MKNTTIENEFSNFSHNVIWLRRHHGLSKKRMAALMGIGIKSLNKIESREMPERMTINVFFNILMHFGIIPGDQLTKRFGE